MEEHSHAHSLVVFWEHTADGREFIKYMKSKQNKHRGEQAEQTTTHNNISF